MLSCRASVEVQYPPARRLLANPHPARTYELSASIESRLQVLLVVLAGERHGGGLGHLLPVLLEESLVDLGLGGRESGSSDKLLWDEKVSDSP